MKRALALVTMLIAATVMAQPAAASVSLPPGSITVPSSGTFFYMNSQPGDYVGGGAESLYTRADTDITGSLEPGGSYFRGHAIQPSYTHWWYIDIAAPVGQPLAVGSYVGAFRAAFRPDGSPGLDISGDGRGCNTLTGKFDITELSFDPVGGELLRFDATFEQHCEGGTLALYGRLRIENEPPTPGVVLPPGSITLPTSGSFFYLHGQGDYIAGSSEQLYTSADSSVSGSLQQGGDYFRGNAIQGAYIHWWYADIAAPPGQPLAVGSYIRAVRAAFRPAGSPGLDIYGDGRGCNTVTGKFDVDELSFWPSGALRVFQATFENHCEGGTAASYGRIRIEAAPPPPPLAVAITLKGEANVNTKTGVVTLTGTVSCSRSVSVDVSGSLSQLVANRATISGSFGTQVSCVAPSTKWTATTTGNNGRFAPGNASATVNASACDLSCGSGAASGTVKLNSSK